MFRILWGVLVLLASLSFAVVSYGSWETYRHPTVTTTVATTRYDCFKFPFPSFTICDTSRVDWQRALKLTERDVPYRGNITMDKVLVLLRSLADITFGDFDFLANIENANLNPRDFRGINIKELLQKVQRPCTEVFHGQCWWREAFYNCCSLFEKQRTDLGFCYSFNNDLSERGQYYSRGYGKRKGSNYWVDWNNEIRPRRASTFGPWSGLRVTIEVMSDKQIPTGTNITPGVMFYLEQSRGFPNSENQRVDPASFVDIRTYGIMKQASKRVQAVDFEDRRCLFLDDRVGINGVYTEHNCLVECQRDYVMKYCNCSSDFLFIEDDATKYPPCDVSGLNCLNKYNLVFNSRVPTSSQEFFKTQKEGMACDCPPDCNSQQFMFDSSISQTQNFSHIGFDIHYKGQYNLLYLSDVTYGPVEFIVAIGGIAGLFLGGSLLSGAEILYFFTFRLFYHWRNTRNMNLNTRPSIKFVY
ncbi:pickpocket protein 19-like isoform X2 [Macrosteles quadrilineatus]|uniref:pickpocket protein 19-like isoform X2 n=1 Tax=Macrosteles quadrilineatus TaxID=74068 RepID=UPI0023E11A02|nr:pickpocket protein 19-like isoform X2 [Macrosteles quadrilineatus]